MKSEKRHKVSSSGRNTKVKKTGAFQATPNNSFNRSANKVAFILNYNGFEIVCAPG
jgi:hypothetical protein